MRYLKLAQNDYPNTHSKAEALNVLEHYRSQLTENEYAVILNSLCSHALENR